MSREIRFGIRLTGDNSGAIQAMRGTEQESRRLRQGMRQIQSQARGTTQGMNTWADSLRGINRVLGPLVGTVGVGMLARATQQAIATTAAIQDGADVAGIGAEQYQELTKGFQDLGNVADTVTEGALRRFNRRFGQARQGTGQARGALEDLGVSLEQETGPALERAIRQLAGIESESDRAATASDLFGETAGPQLAAALGQGEQALDDVIRNLRTQNRVMSQESIDAARELDAQWQQFTDRMSTLFRTATLEVITSARDMMDFLHDELPGFGRDDLAELRFEFDPDSQVNRALRSLTSLNDEIRSIQGGLDEVEDARGLPLQREGDRQALDARESELQDELNQRLRDRRDVLRDLAAAYDPVIRQQRALMGSIADMPAEIQVDPAEVRRRRAQQAAGVGRIDVVPDVDLEALRRQSDMRSMGLGQIDVMPGVDLERAAADMERMNDLTTQRDQILRQIQTPAERYAEQVERLNVLESEGLITREESDRAMQTFRDQLAGATEDTTALSRAGQDLGFTFSSALEDSIIQWESWRDVAASAIEDVQRIILRSTVTQPAGQGLADFIGGINLGGGGSGSEFQGVAASLPGRATGGPVSRRQSYIVGERGPEVLSMGGQSGHVTPNHEIGGDSVTFAPNITVQGGGDDVEERIQRALRRAYPEFEKRIRSRQQRRGRSRV